MIGRRQIFGLGALGLGAAAVGGANSGCGFLPFGKSPSEPDIEDMLRELDHIVAELQTLEPEPKKFGIKPGTDFDAGKATSIRLLRTLCFMGTYRHVPEAVWKEPRIEKRLEDTLPQIHATITAARNHLVEMSDEEYARIDKQLMKDPEIAMRILERVDDYASQINVPIEQRTYLRLSMADLAGRYRHEGMKEVTSKLAAKYDRTLKLRRNELGFPTDEPEPDANNVQTSQATGLKVRFRTRASEKDIRSAACAIEPKVMVEGVERRVVLDSEGAPCPPKTDTNPPIPGTVRIEPAEGGENIVTVIVYSDDQTLSGSVMDIAKHLREVLAARPVPTTTTGPTEQKAPGGPGVFCTAKSDCDGELECIGNRCADPKLLPGSQRLMRFTGKVAKWGAILLIPPICAIGVLVLLQCLFMVIVAGVMYAGGN